MSGTIKGIATAAAAVTALTLGLVGHVSTPRTAPASWPLTAEAASAKAAAARVALLKYLKNAKPSVLVVRRSGLHPGQTISRATTSAAAVTGTSAYNWSGYASWSNTSQEYTAVSANWKVPKVTCTAEQRLSSEWVGLDGYGTTSSSVEQVGTLEWCSEGTATYYTWWEMYPGSPNTTVGTTVKPGDQIAAKVVRSGTSYTLALTDSTTTGNSFSTTQSCAATTCFSDSAEWIDERPAFATTGIAPLAQTSPWTPSGASTTAGGKADTIASAPNPTQIVMIDSTGTYALDSVTALTTTGKSFTTNWLGSY